MCSEAVLTSIPQRKSLFDLEIIGLVERTWGGKDVGAWNTDLGAQPGL